MGSDTEAKKAYLNMVTEEGLPKPKPNKRPIYWRGAALGKELLRLQYAYLYRWHTQQEKLKARQVEIYARIAALYSERDKIVVESYRKLSVQLREALKACYYYDNYYKSALNHLLFRTALHYLKDLERGVALLPLLDTKAGLLPLLPKGYENVSKRWAEDLGRSTTLKETWRNMWIGLSKQMAVHRLPALLSKAFLGKEEALAFPDRDLEDLQPEWVMLSDIYHAMPSFFKGLRFPDWTELTPQADREPAVLEALKEWEGQLTSRSFDPDLVAFADRLLLDPHGEALV